MRIYNNINYVINPSQFIINPINNGFQRMLCISYCKGRLLSQVEISQITGPGPWVLRGKTLNEHGCMEVIHNFRHVMQDLFNFEYFQHYKLINVNIFKEECAIHNALEKL